jgi:hypothetical protein
MRPRAGSIRVPSWSATSTELANRSAQCALGKLPISDSSFRPALANDVGVPPLLSGRLDTDAMSCDSQPRASRALDVIAHHR